LLSVIKVLFLVLFWYHFGIIVLLFWLYCCSSAISSNLFMFCILFYIWNITSGIRAPSSAENCGLIFFKVETYSNVFKVQISIIMHKPVVGDSYMQEIQVVLKRTSIGHPCNPYWYPFSGSASYNTYIRIGLDLMKPSIDKPISPLTVIVPPRTTLGKILSSTWVVV
jgi:hypothetical protein